MRRRQAGDEQRNRILGTSPLPERGVTGPRRQRGAAVATGLIAIGAMLTACQQASTGVSSATTTDYGVALRLPLRQPHIVGTGSLCTHTAGPTEIVAVHWADGAVPITGFSIRRFILGSDSVGTARGTLRSTGFGEEHSVTDVRCGSWSAGEPVFQMLLEVPVADENAAASGRNLTIEYRQDGVAGTVVEPITLSLCGPANRHDPGCS